MIETVTTNQESIDMTTLLQVTSFLKNILSVNIELLARIEERFTRDSHAQSIGDIFLKLTPFLKIYSNYTVVFGDIPTYISSLTRLPYFNTFLTDFQRRINETCLVSLHDVFIMPIQRIPRYSLLLRELLQNTEESHPDFEALTTSLALVQEVATSLNTHLHQEENRRKILEIQSRFIIAYSFQDPQLVAPHRVFIKEGDLQKIGKKAVKQKYLLLFNDILVWATHIKFDRVSTFERLRFENSLPLESMFLKDVPSLPNAFAVQSPKKSFILLSSSAQEKDEWYKILQSQSRSARHHVGSRPRSVSNLEFGFLAPIWVPDYLASSCHSCQTHFNVIHRRHHCRACGFVVCNHCSKHKLVLSSISQEPVRVCNECHTKNTEQKRSHSFLQL
eukprot:TRINITY_DN1421_c0_g1_i1.p1 TRINITY_DN1421_c0_g1~~TRINITY_DN1421_c0_g1_i1.p1  ORF type:complete len:390 (+),score=82.10 TRINITY_DN1421_c0_g1_i1:845-2014(+)